MRKLVAALAIALFVLHHDFWNWNNQSLWFGVLPAGLGYHMLYSLAAASLWGFAAYFAWPFEIEELAQAPDDSRKGGSNPS